MTLEVLYLDNHLLVVNKPAGLLTQEDRTGDPDLLTLGRAFLKERFGKPGRVFLGLVHRLDRPVSGVVVLARTSKAAARLSAQFRQRTPEKRYLALVEGRCAGQGRLIDYLRKADRHVRVVAPGTLGAQQATLSWEALGHDDGLSLVDVVLETGRPHQIRVQLARQGWPILGDFRYGASRELDGRNLALHCYRLCVDHPTLRERMCWTAPPPSSWGDAFARQLTRLLGDGGARQGEAPSPTR
jgi:23S rRNA pseudouridine1911/1915/1917 synthase